ncbi:rhomboid family intramembrane serine protease GlpG [Psychromonas ossibalaenae]|uniref:rhomboid family intramembrane serine protease GlpG n=1 Tax=Psychromonas ossibalaenae TaxID=444922 RepID=UPI000360B30E|nr:rhomboid family intramembrane serine protease GlpG [Psychromonas ossibalaenae]
MFTLHQFQNLRAAQAFSDYLTALNIKNKIQHDDFYYQLLIEQSPLLPRAQAELELFLQNPNDPKYISVSWHTGTTNNDSDHLAYVHSNIISNFISHAGLITHSVFAFCVVIFTLTSLGFFNPIPSVFAFFTQQPFDYTQSWRFVTPAFLHFSLLHIVFNLLWWWQLGGIVEKQHGKQRILILFFFSAVAANLAQYYLVSPYFGGLSGVVYGLVGYCWLYGKLNKGSEVNLPNSYFIFLMAWLVFGFVDLLPVNVANYAHLLGLFAGLVLAAICSKIKI